MRSRDAIVAHTQRTHTMFAFYQPVEGNQNNVHENNFIKCHLHIQIRTYDGEGICEK